MTYNLILFLKIPRNVNFPLPCVEDQGNHTVSAQAHLCYPVTTDARGGGGGWIRRSLNARDHHTAIHLGSLFYGYWVG